MTQKERLVYFINRINSDEELKEEIYNKCDPDTIYPQKELMEDLEWLMEGGSEENYDLVPFANDGSGGLYLLVNDQHIAYFDSEGCAGYVAESVDDFFNILFVFRFFCLSKGVMKSYEQFLKECEEDLFEIKPSEAFERFLIKEKMETDKEKVYEKFIKGLTITPIFEINPIDEEYVKTNNLLGMEEDEFLELCKKICSQRQKSKAQHAYTNAKTEFIRKWTAEARMKYVDRYL